jgi:hypothetical protein
VWEHRIIGLSSYGPGIMPGHGIVFKGAKPGHYKIYLDNLRIRHSDGRTSSIWTDAKDIRTRKIADTELFKDVHVRALPSVSFNTPGQPN